MLIKSTNPEEIKNYISKYPQNIKEITLEIDNKLHTSNLMESSSWPLAINPMFIVNESDISQCQLRSKNIVDMLIETDLNGMSVLDFGCGDGLTALEMLNRGAKTVVGYDIQEHTFWPSSNGLSLTTNLDEVIGPFDFILVYDVLDHIIDQEPSEVLRKLRSVLAEGGIIVIRCHPWVSRHGTHSYKTFNKAFAHLILDSVEGLPTRKIVHPMITYKKWFKEAGLDIMKEEKIHETIEGIFLREPIKSIIQAHYNESPLEDYRNGKGDLDKILGIQFVDFILRKN